ncbi:PAP2 superfamily protein [Halobiforma haloterrestris]|uniref:PAP2 superfamily protein n=1 Tax=Natronobacterium haloterrestre TaxID=148448 RepID=A0A1I1J2B5_NATHA|nr:phosphatase PAP2 family protein [Halobiforma haloterrestris]SFC42644.1 PAP2 superfamily protein [Halobiforma haloterrestris]
MSRGIGGVELVQQYLPEWGAVVLALLTQLGDIWFLATVFAALYWFGVPNRDDVATLAGVWLSGIGFYNGLKELFGFPRPDRPLLETELLPPVVQPLYEATAFATGYGFPSGHAVNATIVYVGLAALLPVGTARTRFGAAAAVVATVSFTRVALGVHYVIDVVVGAAVGLTLLAGTWLLVRRLPVDGATVSFGLAVVFGGFFLATLGTDTAVEGFAVLGAALGAFGGWQLVALERHLGAEPRSTRRSALKSRPAAVRGGLAALALLPLLAALALVVLSSAYAAGGAAGLATAAAVFVPTRFSSRR